MSLDELIQAANQLNETELDRLLQRIVALRAQRKVHALRSEEALLLAQINQGIPSELRAAYQELRAKHEAETLTEEDMKGLLGSAIRLSRWVLNGWKHSLSSPNGDRFRCRR